MGKRQVKFTFKFDTRDAAIKFKEKVLNYYDETDRPKADESKLNCNKITFYAFSDSRKNLQLLDRLIYVAETFDGTIC